MEKYQEKRLKKEIKKERKLIKSKRQWKKK